MGGLRLGLTESKTDGGALHEPRHEYPLHSPRVETVRESHGEGEHGGTSEPFQSRGNGSRSGREARLKTCHHVATRTSPRRLRVGLGQSHKGSGDVAKGGSGLHVRFGCGGARRASIKIISP